MPSIITVGGTSSVSTTGQTFGDLIEKVYRRTMGGIRERAVTINQTNGILSGDTTVVLSGSQTASIMPGVILAIEMELLYVLSWNANTYTATVQRNYLGSAAAAHANGTIVYINPRYSRYDIGVAINDDLRSLSSPSNGLFRVGVAELTYNPVFAGYDLGALPDNFIDILEVRYRIAPPYRTFPAIKRWKVIRWQQNSTDPSFPSGKGLVLYEPGWPGLPIYVTYSAPFLKLVSTSDSLLQTPATNDEAPPYDGYGFNTSVTFTASATGGLNTLSSVSSLTGLYVGMLLGGTGIPSGTTITAITPSTNTITMSASVIGSATNTITVSAASSPNIPNLVPTMLDLPALGAEIDLTLPREISRNVMESQPDPRKAQEVMPGAIASSVNALILRRAQRISEEADRLTRQYTKVRGW
jgi:hypothetical protein